MTEKEISPEALEKAEARAAAKLEAAAKVKLEAAALKKEVARKKVIKHVTDESARMRKETKRVVVRHIGVHPENEYMPIVVNDMGDYANGKKVFSPGGEVVLTLAQIDILEMAVQRSNIRIPDDSAILEAPNVKVEIAKYFQGHHGVKVGGAWFAVMEKPHYIVKEV